MHEVALLRYEVRSVRQANEVLDKRWRTKKTPVRQGGALGVGEVQELIGQKDIDEPVTQEMRQSGGRSRAAATIRRCGTCGKPGHSVRICAKNEDLSGDSNASSCE